MNACENYVIEELKKIKEENERLKDLIVRKENKSFVEVDEKAINVELLNSDVLIKKLEDLKIDIPKICDEMSSEEITNLIIDNKLYKEVKENSSTLTIVRYNSKYYKLQSKYSYSFELEEQCYITLHDAVYYELSDNLNDIAYNYKRKKEQENE